MLPLTPSIRVGSSLCPAAGPTTCSVTLDRCNLDVGLRALVDHGFNLIGLRAATIEVEAGTTDAIVCRVLRECLAQIGPPPGG